MKKTESADRLCMCAMLAGEIETVPDIVKIEASRFFEEQDIWLVQVIEQGIKANVKNLLDTFFAFKP